MKDNFYKQVTPINDKEEEIYDTLSLSDLPLGLSSDSDDWDNFSIEDQIFSSISSSLTSSDSDVFEFFIPNCSHNSHPIDNVLFCGKLINTHNPKTEPRSNLTPKKCPNKLYGSRVKQQKAVFGVKNVTVEMELSEMRRRQRKLIEVDQLSGGGNDGKKRREKRLWGVIGALSCNGTLSTAILTASTQSNKPRTTRFNVQYVDT